MSLFEDQQDAWFANNCEGNIEDYLINGDTLDDYLPENNKNDIEGGDKDENNRHNNRS